MKKYQQLCLAILSIFSFSCLLIYRHEYNKLRYVLEVLNFFGSPGMPAAPPLSPSACPDPDPLNEFTLRGPLPAWQRISDSFYVYSAFWERLDGVGNVKAYAIGSLSENFSYGCFLWYDSDPKTKTGQLNHSVLTYKNQEAVFNGGTGDLINKAEALILYCKPLDENNNAAPIGITFFHKSLNQTLRGFVPIVNVVSSAPPQNSTGICLMPNQFPQFDKSDYYEFLNFHKLIGINNFIVYGGIDLHNLLSSKLIDSKNKVKVTVLNWNYPFSEQNELMKVIAENDCKSRTRGLIENVAILEWNKFLVPRYIISLSKLLNELEKNSKLENGGKKLNKFVFSTLLFCTEYKDYKSNHSIPIIFRKMRYSLPKNDIQVPIHKPHLTSGQVQRVGKDVIAVHQYSSCRDYKLKLGVKKNQVIDMIMLKFQSEFLKSQIPAT